MHSKKDSILKRWHTFRANPDRCAKKWQGQYWRDVDGMRVVACRDCPSFNGTKQQCSINFGSPIRKCVVSSIEAHLHNCSDKDVLEIGFGKFKLAKNLVQRSGGTWTGVEPRRPKDEKPSIGKGGYGHATSIPFAASTFDKIFAIQSIEHWGQRAGGVREPSSYSECIAEIARVLKSGGDLYLDAPVHFHGNEMFIVGDIDKVKSFFPARVWKNVHIEQWRKEYEPLDIFVPPDNLIKDWPIELCNYCHDKIDEIRTNEVVWMMAITAEKI